MQFPCTWDEARSPQCAAQDWRIWLRHCSSSLCSRRITLFLVLGNHVLSLLSEDLHQSAALCLECQNATSLVLCPPNSCSASRSQLTCHFSQETPPGLLCETTGPVHLGTPRLQREHPLQLCGMAA